MNNSMESIFVDVSPYPLTQNKCATLGVIYRLIQMCVTSLRICQRYLRI